MNPNNIPLAGGKNFPPPNTSKNFPGKGAGNHNMGGNNNMHNMNPPMMNMANGGGVPNMMNPINPQLMASMMNPAMNPFLNMLGMKGGGMGGPMMPNMMVPGTTALPGPGGAPAPAPRPPQQQVVAGAASKASAPKPPPQQEPQDHASVMPVLGGRGPIPGYDPNQKMGYYKNPVLLEKTDLGPKTVVLPPPAGGGPPVNMNLSTFRNASPSEALAMGALAAGNTLHSGGSSGAGLVPKNADGSSGLMGVVGGKKMFTGDQWGGGGSRNFVVPLKFGTDFFLVVIPSGRTSSSRNMVMIIFV